MSDTHSRSPMEIMKAIIPEGARTYMDHRAAVMANPLLAALPEKTKLLIGVGVAAALQSATCTLMWTRLAVKAGASREEVGEALLVARLMKMATLNDAAADALAWLEENPPEGCTTKEGPASPQ